jgi:hypothetical protein
MTTVKYSRFLECMKIRGRAHTLTLALTALCKMSEIHEIGVRHQIYQRIIFCGQLAGINLDF